MKALFLSDDINQFHWSLLKSVSLILSLLPLSQVIWNFWQTTEGSSQIVVGFFAISFFVTGFVLAFWSALKLTTWHKVIAETSVEQAVLAVYRNIPMICLVTMMSYLAFQ